MQKPLPKLRASLGSCAYPCRFAEHDSPVHRMGAGLKLLLGLVLSTLAAGGRTPASLALLVAANLGYYLAARLTPGDLWRDVRLFFFQAALVIPLYCLVDGVGRGLWSGVRVSTQIVLFYLPGAVFLHTTRTSEAMAGLRRILPYRLSFLVFVSVRFVPLFFKELEEIVALQRLRGARVSPRELLNPRNWPDLFNCVLLPLVVRAFRTADEVSRSAEARAFGLHRERTYLDPARLHDAGKGRGEGERHPGAGVGASPAKNF